MKTKLKTVPVIATLVVPASRPASWLVLLTLLAMPPALLARRGEKPPSRRPGALSATAIPVSRLPAVDVTKELALDEIELKTVARPPLRYAVPFQVSITPETAGRWETLADGTRLWRMRFHVPGATDLNFGFTRFRLPPGASVYVVSETEDYYEGPYTHLDTEEHGELWTPLVPGDRAWIELYLPAGTGAGPQLELTQVAGGYRDLVGRGGIPKQGSCNNDVICPEGDLWRDEIRSVAVYSRGGSLLCTGTLIMDVPRSFRPFFLTANHCGVDAGNAASMVVYWNFESPVCGQLGGGSLADNQTGAVFRAARYDVDMTLVELDDSPDPSFGVFYSGWDRSGSTPLGSVGIHHPATDEKAISFNTDPLSTINSCILTGGSNTHWKVDNWEDGTTEQGSSGSGLWDPDTHKLVGFLSGGDASCSYNGSDCYGKFSVAWDLGPSAATRLKEWLDPEDQGTLMVDGADPRSKLQNGVPVTGLSAGAGEAVRFFLELPDGADNLEFSMSGGSGDADLYVNFASPPTLSTWACRPYLPGNDETCYLPFPAPGTWYVMVYGYEAFSDVSLVGRYDSPDLIFADGFESGDLSSWSSSVR